MGAAETGRGWFGELDRDGALNGLLLSRSVDDSVAAFTDQGIQAVVAKLHSRLDLWRVVTDRGARIFVVWHISMIDKAIHTELPRCRSNRAKIRPCAIPNVSQESANRLGRN